MSHTVITVEHLSKKYLLKQKNEESYVALRDVITHSVKNIFRNRSFSTFYSEEFLALNDVSFDIQQGDRVGIIGRNGAGKSTLLKILSRIVTPTKGRITIEGRVSSLLEVGTGFHAELSGRENIFLNGSILGMTRSEIKNKFDEIVAFAEIEKFLDTPVKRYSSGMYVRLAFAVAAHLDPEILIVDEVLAVGDAGFQRKCLGKMKDVAGEGRTVLFVSHNMGQISALCSKSIILNKGKIEFYGKVDEGLKIYHNIQLKESRQFYKAGTTEKEAFIAEAEVKNRLNKKEQTFTHNEPVLVYFKFEANLVIDDLLLSISVSDKNETKIFSTEISISPYITTLKKTGEAVLKIPGHFLLPGDYKIKAGIHIPNVQEFDSVDNICSFTIIDNGSEFSKYEGVNMGYVFSECEWMLK